MQEIDVRQQVGTAERLPPLDILGRPRREGYSTRHVGDGRVVAIPPGISRTVEESAVQAIVARLDAARKALEGRTVRGEKDR